MEKETKYYYLDLVCSEKSFYGGGSLLPKVVKYYNNEKWYNKISDRKSFPVLAEEKEDGLYDVILGFKYYDDICYDGICYENKTECPFNELISWLRVLNSDKRGVLFYEKRLYECYRRQVVSFNKSSVR